MGHTVTRRAKLTVTCRAFHESVNSRKKFFWVFCLDGNAEGGGGKTQKNSGEKSKKAVPRNKLRGARLQKKRGPWGAPTKEAIHKQCPNWKKKERADEGEVCPKNVFFFSQRPNIFCWCATPKNCGTGGGWRRRSQKETITWAMQRWGPRPDAVRGKAGTRNRGKVGNRNKLKKKDGSLFSPL